MGELFIGNVRGPQGVQGPRGAAWHVGNGIVGTVTEPTAYPDSGVAEAKTEDMYLNSDSGNVYQCRTAGTPNEALWVFACNIMGPEGKTGGTEIGTRPVTFTEAEEKQPLVSGESLTLLFGKLAKFMTVTDEAFNNLLEEETIQVAKETGFLSE